MNVILKEQHCCVLRFDKNEEVISLLSEYCRKNEINGGHFTAIGASSSATIAYYDLETKTYVDKTIDDSMEIAGVIGNVALLDGKQIIHAHGSFANRSFQTFAGHIKKLIVSATCEVHLRILIGVMRRGLDNETGLNILKSD